MAKCDYTVPFLIKLSQFFQRTKRNFKCYIPSSMTVLHYTINIFGLNISCHNGKFRKNLVRICQKFAVLCIIFLLLMVFFTSFNLGLFSKYGLKTLFSYITVEGSSCILWSVMFFSQKKMSDIYKYIIKLRKAVNTSQSDRFTSICIIYTFLIYILNVICDIYPFTDDRYDELLSYFFIPNIGSKYLTRGIVFTLCSIYHALVDLLPQCFITLYVILCHYMHTILIMYIKRNKATKAQCKARIIKWFDYYQSVMHTFELFEKNFSLSMYLVFSKSVIDTFFNVMYIYVNGIEVSIDVCRVVVNFISITSVTFVASQFSETDKIAKATNLENLEVLLKIDKQLQFDKVLKIWKLNNSPPCTLSAWGFFSFSKNLYLNVIHIVITYSLLVINL